MGYMVELATLIKADGSRGQWVAVSQVWTAAVILSSHQVLVYRQRNGDGIVRGIVAFHILPDESGIPDLPRTDRQGKLIVTLIDLEFTFQGTAISANDSNIVAVGVEGV